jgi:PAS domain S-box-containing protein
VNRFTQAQGAPGVVFVVLRRFFPGHEKVINIAAAMLIVAALTTGIACFSVQQRMAEKALSGSLGGVLKDRISLVQDVLRHSMVEAGAIAARPDLLRAMQVLRYSQDDPQALAQLRNIGVGTLSPDVTGLAVYNVAHREIMEFGRFSERSDLATKLEGLVPSTLFWNGALYLNSRLPIVDRGETIGFVAVERLLPLLTERMSKTDGLGQTGRMAMCVSRPDHLSCFPRHPGEEVYRIPRHDQMGQELAMRHAVGGQFGVFEGLDSRGRTVMSAYGPVDASGLGMVIKQDTEELFRPIRNQLELIIPVLLVLVGLGAWLSRLHVKPLASQLLLSEFEARKRELKTRTVVDNVGEGIITVDAMGVIESFNNAACGMFGYTQEEVVGQNIRMLIPPQLREWHREGMRRYLLGQDAHIVGRKNVELLGLHKGGGVFHLELTLSEMRVGKEQGEQRVFVGITRDITLRKQAEDALRTAHAGLEVRVQQRTAELLNANEMLNRENVERSRIEETLRFTRDILTKAQAIAQLGSWELDVHSGQMKWSDEFYRLCGMRPQAVPASQAFGLDLIHEDDREAAQQAMTDVLAGGAGCKHELRIIRPDGLMKHVLAQGELMYNEKREPATLVCTFLDITEHKTAEAALRQSREKLRKMAAHQDRIKEDERKRIAREIHDELGGVLTGIKSCLTFVVEEGERSGAAKNVQVLAARDLADSAIETARRVITDLRPSVLDQLGLWAALEWHAGQIEERTGLTCSMLIDEKTELVDVDGQRSIALFRIVQETLTNVVRHAKASRVAIVVASEGGCVTIEVKDDGIGVEPQSLLNRESWGIEGMYERARFFGGDLSINGIVGQGTTVVLRMPLEEAYVR